MADARDLHQDAEDLVLRYFANPQPDLKDLIMVRYGSMVERIARKFLGLEPLEDLIQVGYIGLLNALSKFNPNAGVRFNTYATYLVAGEIKHYLRDRSQTIRQPAWLQELRHKVNRAASVLQQDLGRQPTTLEIAEHLRVAVNTVEDVLATQDLLKVASLDSTPMNDDDADSDVDRLDAAEFCSEQLSVEDRVVLEQALQQLRDLEREVLVRFHFEAKNQTEIAAELGISCNYVSHILRQSLTKLRKILSHDEAAESLMRRQADALDQDVVDPAVGAYTHRYFRARLEEEVHRAASRKEELSLILIRFQGLERLRAFYGQQSILDFLADAHEFLKENVRRLDIISRYGNDGFAIILPFTGDRVAIVHQRIVDKIANWLTHRNGASGPVSVSIGFSSFPEDARTMEGMVRSASESMRVVPHGVEPKAA
ncbi:MAG: sigma-70 family RNA polymerase sigma factor [Fimbriimonadales bacterium]|nr:sigma-70 family RNA polymerase sigma factor [Fimbriimonadales bacterium]